MSILFSIIFGLFDNSHGKWNMQDIKKVGLAIGLKSIIDFYVDASHPFFMQVTPCYGSCDQTKVKNLVSWESILAFENV